MKSSVATRSAFADDAAVSVAAIERHEHHSNIRRLRTALGVAPGLWLAAGIPSDLLLATMSGRSPLLLLVVRLVVAAAIFIGLLCAYARATPTKTTLAMIELFVFGALAAGAGVLVALDRGVASATAGLLSCILLAQGVALPRPWRQSVVPLGCTAAVFVIVVAIACAPELRNPEKLTFFLSMLYVAGGSMALLVVGGQATWAVRRLVFEARQIGRYQLRKKVGQGGMGEVWRAYHPGLKRDVALKILRGSQSAKAHERFLIEIEAMARLSHPNTVRVLDRGVSDGDQWYYAMEIVEGPTLKALVDEHGPLPVARAAHIVEQAARALAEAHDKGIVHCDLKPENLIVTSLGTGDDFVKVCDFGIACIDHQGANRAGTVLYAAPEQLAGGDVDARADVYAIGAVLHFALCGASPAERPELPEDVPAHIRAIIERCLAADPAERFPNASDVVRAIVAAGAAGGKPPPYGSTSI